MQTVMWSSIQDYCKKINREITFTTIFSLFLTAVFLVGLTIYIRQKESSIQVSIVYTEASNSKNSTESLTLAPQDTSKPFGSKKGKTYTFTWCQGGNKILEKNKLYFSSEESAKTSGRTLSKLCKK